jgi:hypothetical protein
LSFGIACWYVYFPLVMLPLALVLAIYREQEAPALLCSVCKQGSMQ